MQPIAQFTVARLSQILFGEGRLAEVANQVAIYGRRVLIVTGARSFQTTANWTQLQAQFQAQQLTWYQITVSGEPTPDLVDETVKQYKNQGIEVVLGIGGGSVLDAAKAIAGLLPFGNSVMDHLEGVGRGLAYLGPALPFIAVPTTAGTGSEATKNAVLSQQGAQGFKKSFRHDSLVPKVAIVDPNLLISCPPDLLAANGMDAFTQLLESYTSTQANPFTDALAISGMSAFRDGFFPAWECQHEAAARVGRSQIAYASLLSGITLAQTGLGVVHGLAAPLGAFFPAPHGVVCGTLLAAATATNIHALQTRMPNDIALSKYSHIGRLLIGKDSLSDQQALEQLISTLHRWTQQLNLPRLGTYGMQLEHVDKVVAASQGNSMKTNPIKLTNEELSKLLKERL